VGGFISNGGGGGGSGIPAGGITDGDVADGAAIDYSKLALALSIQLGDLAFDPATQAELDTHTADSTAVHGIADTSALVLTGDARLSDQRTPSDLSVTNAKVAANAAIAMSKLALAITDAEIASGAAISKSKLGALGIVNADVATAAAIAYSKLALTGAIQVADLAFDPATQAELDAAKIYRTGHTIALMGGINVPSGTSDVIPPFFVAVPAGKTAKIVAVRSIIGAGTSVTAKLTKNGVDIAEYSGANAIAVSTSAASVTPGSPPSVASADLLQLVVTAVSGSPENLSVTIVIEVT
jgi:hypothetical protein